MTAKVIHIYSTDKEIDEIFDAAVSTIDRALELFSMIEHQDSGAKLMARNTYKLLKQGEDLQNGWVPDE